MAAIFLTLDVSLKYLCKLQLYIATNYEHGLCVLWFYIRVGRIYCAIVPFDMDQFSLYSWELHHYGVNLIEYYVLYLCNTGADGFRTLDYRVMCQPGLE